MLTIKSTTNKQLINHDYLPDKIGYVQWNVRIVLPVII